eukprot:bmy_06636T0
MAEPRTRAGRQEQAAASGAWGHTRPPVARPGVATAGTGARRRGDPEQSAETAQLHASGGRRALAGLFSSTHFFLCVDPSGRVQGTRWRDSPDSGVFELRSIRVGVVALKAVNTGFYVAMNRRGRLSRSVSASARGGLGYVGRARRGRVQGRAQGRLQAAPQRVCARFRERIEENGYNTYASVRWRHRGRPMLLALDAGGGAGRAARGPRGAGSARSDTTRPRISCPSWSPEAQDP